jgi:3-oxoacyl-[acyl-carrier protein] reductase
MGFAREGAHVVICSRNKKLIQAAAEDIRKAAGQHAGRVVAVAADLTRAKDIATLFRKTMKEFGRIDILVTNAGGPPVAMFPDLDDATWSKGVDLTLMSAIRCIREALPHMQKKKWGRIINITSIAARQPVNDLVISSTLRPGILGLTKVLANQYAKDGILINSVTPGYILTARQREISNSRAAAKGVTVESYMKELTGDVPLGRYGEPEELANVIVFLGSEKASYITGATISVDGGLAKGLL